MPTSHHANKLIGFRPPAELGARIRAAAATRGQTLTELLTEWCEAGCEAVDDLAPPPAGIGELVDRWISEEARGERRDVRQEAS